MGVVLGRRGRPAERAHAVAEALACWLIEHRRMLLRRRKASVHDRRLVRDVVIEVSPAAWAVERIDRRHRRCRLSALLPTTSASLLTGLVRFTLGIRLAGCETVMRARLGEVATELLAHRRERRRIAAAGRCGRAGS